MTGIGLQLCAACGHRNPPDARFCNQCGVAIAGAATASPYTPRHLSEKILQNRSALEGERKQVTVLFVDIKGSVALSRGMDAEQWHRILDRFFAMLTEAVHRYEGTINQYTGDGIMALFGAPIAHEDHASRACRAALDIQREMRGLAAELQNELNLEFRIRQGLNSGEVVVGRIGDDLRMDYTAKGETVGLAARMEATAQPDTIFLTAYTRDLLEDQFELEERGTTLVRGIRQKVRSYQLNGVKSRDSSGPREDTRPLVGRDRELKLLCAYRRQVVEQGAGLLVAISADTGLGKSRICREFVRQCCEDGVPVYGVHGSSHHRAEPLAPVRELFSSYFDFQLDEDPVAMQAKVQQRLKPYMPLPPMLLDNLLVVLGLEPGDAPEREDNHLRVELAMALMLRLLSEGAFSQHQVWVLENVHWLDDARARPLLDALVDMLPHVPVLVVMTARSDYTYPWRRLRQVRELALQPWSATESARYLETLLGDDAELDDLRQAIIERAGGNPMFIEEVVAQLLASGVLERDGRRVRLKKKAAAIELPPSVQAVVAARIDALPYAAKRLLQTAAVIGRRVPLELLRAVYPEEDFEAGLDILKQQSFLQRDVTPDSRNALLFSQSLFQVVAYDALLKDQRQDIHRRVAAAMRATERQDSQALAQRARHHAAAGETLEAIEAFLGSAECGARTDLQEAMRRLDRARELLTEFAEAPDDLRLRVLSRWLQFAARRGLEPTRFRDALQQGEELAKSAVSLENRLLFALARSSAALAAARPNEAVEVLFEVQGVVGDNDDSALHLLLLVPLVYALIAEGRLVEALEHADRGLDYCAGDAECGARAMSYSPLIALTVLKAWLSLWLGRPRQARLLAGEALRLSRERRHNEQIISAQSVLSYVEAESDSAEIQLAVARRSLQQARGLKNPAMERLALIAFGRCLIRSGEVTEAIVTLETDIADHGGPGFGLGEAAWLQADLSLAQLQAGNARGARDIAQRAVRAAEKSGARLTEISARLAQIRAGLFSRRSGSFLRRYAAPLERCEALIEGCEARLLQPEYLLLRASWLEQRDELEEAHSLRARAVRLLNEFDLRSPPMFEDLDRGAR